MKRKTVTKSGFFSRLRFLLSFRYSELECQEMLSDYEEWFEEECRNGKTDAQICSHLGSPAQVAGKIALETKSEASRFFILLHHPFLQFLCAAGICIWMQWLAYRYWEIYGWNYFYAALGINALYFICGMAAVKGRDCVFWLKREHFFTTAVFAAVLLFNVLLLMVDVGAWVGVLAVRLHTAVVCVLYAVTIIRGAWNIMEKKGAVYMQAMHGLGLAPALVFIITQYHTLYQGPEEFLRAVILGSGGIYLEALCLTVLFGLCKGGKRRRSWMRS